MLCFDHVSFAYPGERTILNDLSFSVSEGEQVGLIGDERICRRDV